MLFHKRKQRPEWLKYEKTVCILFRTFWKHSDSNHILSTTKMTITDIFALVTILVYHNREKTLKSPLDNKEIKPVNPKGNQPWIFTGRTNAEAEVPILWQPDVKSWLIGKDPDARKDWGKEEKGATENEMIGWYHWLNGHEFEQTLGDGEGQGSLVCCSTRGCKESDMTEQLNWTEKSKELDSTFGCVYKLFS